MKERIRLSKIVMLGAGTCMELNTYIHFISKNSKICWGTYYNLINCDRNSDSNFLLFFTLNGPTLGFKKILYFHMHSYASDSNLRYKFKYKELLLEDSKNKSYISFS